MSPSPTKSYVDLLFILIAAGCAAPSDVAPQVAVKTLAIEDGTPETGYPAVGLLDRSDRGGTCTGTLIAPDVVLTAEHCLKEGTYRFYPEGYPAGVGIRNVVPYPRHVRDLQLAYLEESLPIEPMLVNQGPVPPVGTECLAVGYGNHHESATSVTDGAKRSAVVSISRVYEPASIDVEKVTGIATDGDSGGPLLCKVKVEDDDGHEVEREVIVGAVRVHTGEWPDHVVETYTTVDAAWIRDPSTDPGEGFVCSDDSYRCVVDENGRTGAQTCSVREGLSVVWCNPEERCQEFADGGAACQFLSCDQAPMLECDVGWKCVLPASSGPVCEPDASEPDASEL